MQVKAMERKWDGVWPETWPRKVEFGRESIVWHLYHNAMRNPDKPAFLFYGTEITYRQLNNLVWQAAGSLKRFGVKKGDRVYLALENCPQFAIAYYATLALGAIVIPGSPMNKALEMKYLLDDSQPKIVIIEDLLYPIYHMIKESATSVEKVVVTSLGEYMPQEPTLPIPPGITGSGQDFPDTIDWKDFLQGEPIEQLEPLDVYRDVALLQYTSGTTGAPKGAMITHFNLMASTLCSAYVVNAHVDDRFLAVLPYFHITGMNTTLNGPIYLGSTIVLIARFDPETLLMAVDKYKLTMWTSIATMNIAIINHPNIDKYDISSIKFLGSGGATVPPAVVEKYKKLANIDLIEGYGMSETAALIISNPLNRNKLGSIGIPIIGLDIRIANLDNKAENVKLGEEGELWVKGPSVSIGYWNRPEATAETFIGDGWLKTGDVVKMDEEGYIYICGRTKEMIKASGYSVYPAEVEEYLYQHPAIAECCVIGVPHEYRGEQVKAFVVLRPDWIGKISDQELIDWAREQMAVYKYPRIMEIREALPKNAIGKIMRRILKEEEEQKQVAASTD